MRRQWIQQSQEHALRTSGIDVVGDVPWGTHFCHFYETKEDLLDTLVPYFKAGLEAGEFCVWVVPEPLTIGEAWGGLREHVPGLDRYVARHSIEVFPARDWYLRQGEFDLRRVTAAWNDKLERALARGYPGMRVSGNIAWLEKKDWRDFCQYEEQLNNSIGNQRMAVLCPYPLTTTGALDLLDVVRNHQFTIAKRRGNWEVVETPELQKVKAHIEALNKDLERRVAERTEQLEATNEELRSEIDERTRTEAQLEAIRDALDARPDGDDTAPRIQHAAARQLGSR